MDQIIKLCRSVLSKIIFRSILLIISRSFLKKSELLYPTFYLSLSLFIRTVNVPLVQKMLLFLHFDKLVAYNNFMHSLVWSSHRQMRLHMANEVAYNLTKVVIQTNEVVHNLIKTAVLSVTLIVFFCLTKSDLDC